MDPSSLEKDPNSSQQELWVVRDDELNSRWEFTCKTLYKLQMTKKTSRELERKYYVPYDSLWKYFGVDISSCIAADIKMFTSFLLDTMELEMPTMNMQRNKNDDSDAEEEVHIKLKEIGIVWHARHIVDIEGTKLPLTISLIGNHEKYLGIKAVVYNRAKRKEEGVFLRVDTEEWRLDDEIIKGFPKARAKDPLKYYYSLPKILEEQGFEYIFKSLKFSQDKIPFIANELEEMTNIDVFTKKTLTRLSTQV